MQSDWVVGKRAVLRVPLHIVCECDGRYWVCGVEKRRKNWNIMELRWVTCHPCWRIYGSLWSDPTMAQFAGTLWVTIFALSRARDVLTKQFCLWSRHINGLCVWVEKDMTMSTAICNNLMIAQGTYFTQFSPPPLSSSHVFLSIV